MPPGQEAEYGFPGTLKLKSTHSVSQPREGALSRSESWQSIFSLFRRLELHSGTEGTFFHSSHGTTSRNAAIEHDFDIVQESFQDHAGFSIHVLCPLENSPPLLSRSIPPVSSRILDGRSDPNWRS